MKQKRLHSYSPRDLNKMVLRLGMWAANKECVAAMSVHPTTLAGCDGHADKAAQGLREDAAMMDDIANVLTQLSKRKAGAKP
ncbi:MAG: hypothetical protein AAFY12_12290 [Pseudomonadota bacterium]